MSGIRVAYSGLIAFVVGMISILTGFVFVLTITRSLSPEEFGTWSLIGSMISYFLISESIIFFWTIRQVARGDEIGKTSVISTLIFSFAAIPFYLIASFYVSDNSNSDPNAMFFAAILVPLFFLSNILIGINTAHRPQATSYGLLIFEVSKIPLVLLLVYVFDLGLYGTITTMFLAFLIRIAAQFYFAQPKLHNTLRFSELRRWIRLSWLSLYNNLPKFMINLDVLVYTLVTGSVIGVAYYAVSFTIAGIILHTNKINQALYPKLVAKGSHAYFQENFRLLLYLALPLLAIIIVFSEPAIFALNPIYQGSSIIAIILAFSVFFATFVEMFRQALLGIESIDVDKTASFAQMAKSKLFFISSIWSLKSVIYLIMLVVTLYILNFSSVSEIELVIAWVLVHLFLEVPFFIYALLLLRKNLEFKIPFLPILKYVFATLCLVGVYYTTSNFLIIYHESIFDFLPGVALQFLFCLGVYLAITYAIDKKIRVLTRSVFAEFSKK